jgi:hypothetical protein
MTSRQQNEVEKALEEVIYSIIYTEKIPLEGLYERILKEFKKTEGFRKINKQKEVEQIQFGNEIEDDDLNLESALKNLTRRPIPSENIQRDRHEVLNIVERSEKAYSSKKTSKAGSIKDDENEEEEDFKGIMEQFFKEFTKTMKETRPTKTEPKTRETRLVDFPTFRGEQQDPIAWLEAFEGTCAANGVEEERMIKVVNSYLKGEAHTWFMSQTIKYWDRADKKHKSFVSLFTDEYCSIYRRTQWD